MNKVKLSLIAIATLVASNVNAQTYYSCIPEGCPAGQYFDGVKCLALPKLTACPSGKYFDGVNCLDLPTGGTGSSNCVYSFTTFSSNLIKSQKGSVASCKSVVTGNNGVSTNYCSITLVNGDSVKVDGKTATCVDGKMQ